MTVLQITPNLPPVWGPYGEVAVVRPMTADEITANTAPADPKAELIAQVDRATTLDEVKAALQATLQSLS